MAAECVNTDRELAREDFEAHGAVLQFARQAKAKEEIQAENLDLERLNAGGGSAMLMQRMSSGTLVLSPFRKLQIPIAT